MSATKRGSIRDKVGYQQRLGNRGKLGNSINLKEKKVLRFALAVNYDFYTKRVCRFPVARTEEKNGTTKVILGFKYFTSPYQNSNKEYGVDFRPCPLSDFNKFLKNRNDINDDEIIFQIQVGDEIKSILKGELLGKDSYGYKKSTKLNTRYVIPVVDLDDVEKGVQVLELPWGKGTDLFKDIDIEIDELGEMGDPIQNPYPFRLDYDEKAEAANMYKIKTLRAPKFEKIVEENMDVIESTGLEVVNRIKPYEVSSEQEIHNYLLEYTKGSVIEDDIVNRGFLTTNIDKIDSTQVKKTLNNIAEKEVVETKTTEETKNTTAPVETTKSKAATTTKQKTTTTTTTASKTKTKKVAEPTAKKTETTTETHVETETTTPAETETTSETKDCPICDETITQADIDANRCPHCDSDLDDAAF